MFSLRFASEVGEVKTKQTEKLPGLAQGFLNLTDINIIQNVNTFAQGIN
jgi:hypothetical protein